MKYTIIYCYDAYCGWCFAFSEVLYRCWLYYKAQVNVEVLSGGMILPKKPVHISATAGYIRQSYPEIEKLTGVSFGPDYLWHINNDQDSDWYPDSLKPAVALCIVKEYDPDKQVPFARDIQHALFKEGRDLCDDEAYRHLLMRYNIVPEDFYQKLHSPLFAEKARDEFAAVKQLNVTGFPALFVQVSESKFYQVANGYTDFDTLKGRLDFILSSLS